MPEDQHTAATVGDQNMRYVTVPELCRLTGWNRNLVYRMIRDRQLAHLQLRGKKLVRLADVTALIERATVPAVEPAA
jgi:excisionase family DNA binding protein